MNNEMLWFEKNKVNLLGAIWILSSFTVYADERLTSFTVVTLPAVSERQEEGTLFTQIVNAAEEWLSRQPGMIRIEKDTLFALFGEQLTPNFADKYECFSLAEANRNLGLNTILFCSVQREKGASLLQIEAFEFPSGIFTARISIRLLKSPELNWDKIFARTFKSLLTTWHDADVLLGQRFNENEVGLLVLTDELQDSSYLEKCQSFLKYLQVDETQQAMRLKILLKHRVVTDDDICANSRTFLDRIAAKAIFYLHKQEPPFDITMLIPPDSLASLPVYEWPLPVHPDNPSFTCLHFPADSAHLKLASKIFFQGDGGVLKLFREPDIAAGAGLFANDDAFTFLTCTKKNKLLRASGAILNSDSTNGLELGYQRLILHSSDQEVQAWSGIHLGEIYLASDRVQQAFRPLHFADSLFTLLRDRNGAVISCVLLAKVLTALKQWPDVREMYRKIIKMPSDSLTTVFATQRIAFAYEMEDRIEEAISQYRLAALLNTHMNRLYDAAQLYDHIAKILRQKGQLRRSIAYLDTFLLGSEELSNEPGIARAHFQLGSSMFALNELDGALSHFTKAIDYLEMLGDRCSIARADLNIGSIYWQKGDTLKARQHYFSALQQAEACGDSTIILISCANIAEWCLAKKDWLQAQMYYDRALSVAEKSGDLRERVHITHAKGAAYVQEGRLRTAYAWLKKALDLGGGSATGDAKKEQDFLQKIESIIDKQQGKKNSTNGSTK